MCERNYVILDIVRAKFFCVNLLLPIQSATQVVYITIDVTNRQYSRYVQWCVLVCLSCKIRKYNRMYALRIKLSLLIQKKLILNKIVLIYLLLWLSGPKWVLCYLLPDLCVHGAEVFLCFVSPSVFRLTNWPFTTRMSHTGSSHRFKSWLPFKMSESTDKRNRIV